MWHDGVVFLNLVLVCSLRRLVNSSTFHKRGRRATGRVPRGPALESRAPMVSHVALMANARTPTTSHCQGKSCSDSENQLAEDTYTTTEP